MLSVATAGAMTDIIYWLSASAVMTFHTLGPQIIGQWHCDGKTVHEEVEKLVGGEGSLKGPFPNGCYPMEDFLKHWILGLINGYLGGRKAFRALTSLRSRFTSSL